MIITRDEVFDILMDIKKYENMNKFIIDVGDFLELHTPYSETGFVFDNVEDCINDLNYCLTYEVAQKGRKKCTEKK